ncbi:MAG: HPr kinase/phosphatase C-terminal domain-containing protein [Proteobacteria bacterium]|nr:HPr kinase/phosphatase C-terminal domain-containing protein [Pseudomonadota bacterium]MBI3498457.1 HPr kinase/phosphatase C-terminal domain-containing protein [Pseudomonadota bacterium]
MADLFVHATSVAIGGRAVLLTGAPGAGKSDLALRLIDRGASLIADDQTRLVNVNGRLIARAPPEIRGLIEVRGLGIVAVRTTDEAPVALAVDLVRPELLERLPEPEWVDFLGVRVRRIKLAAFEASAVAKLHLAVHTESDR